MDAVVKAVLGSGLSSLGVRRLTHTIVRSPATDSGVYRRPHESLRPLLSSHRFAVALFDYHGCGAEHRLEVRDAAAHAQELLERNGWAGRARAICIDPELERWIVCTRSPMAEELGISERSVHEALRKAGHLPNAEGKFDDPKAAWEVLLRATKTGRSAALYVNLARGLRLDQCTDPAFVKLVGFLRRHFPA
ncbi:MAG: hypothetical protein GF320_07775 [Armatimonadia bacterium]|nr:hypothetical protein [Armatimonadia bacterium]